MKQHNTNEADNQASKWKHQNQLIQLERRGDLPSVVNRAKRLIMIGNLDRAGVVIVEAMKNIMADNNTGRPKAEPLNLQSGFGWDINNPWEYK